jgi:exodeoxyribonuclease V alpha subunit
VERVTYFNEESGFSVLRVKVRGQREPVTVLGSLSSVSAGEWLTAEGWWVRDKETVPGPWVKFATADN